jgi:hypothetical protein
MITQRPLWCPANDKARGQYGLTTGERLNDKLRPRGQQPRTRPPLGPADHAHSSPWLPQSYVQNFREAAQDRGVGWAVVVVGWSPPGAATGSASRALAADSRRRISAALVVAAPATARRTRGRGMRRPRAAFRL